MFKLLSRQPHQIKDEDCCSEGFVHCSDCRKKLYPNEQVFLELIERSLFNKKSIRKTFICKDCPPYDEYEYPSLKIAILSSKL